VQHKNTEANQTPVIEKISSEKISSEKISSEKTKTPDAELTAFENRLQSLNDTELVMQVQGLLQREKRIGDAILLGLKEIKARRVFAALGYPSLFEFLVKHFGLSESATYQRLQALKLIEAVPEVQNDLFNGTLSLSNAALVQSFIQSEEKQSTLTAETKKHLIESIKCKTHKEARVILARENPVSALPPSREKPMTSTHSQLQITVDQETIAALQDVKELLSHTIPDGDLAQVLKYMLQLTSSTLRKRKGQVEITKSEMKRGFSVLEKNRTESNSNSNSNSSHSVANVGSIVGVTERGTDAKKGSVKRKAIPIDVKRKVFTRAGGCCEYQSTTGHRCASRHQLEIDHITPVSQGGSSEIHSLQLLCRTHNQFRLKETHGFWFTK
jgi:5-methylcytosine-specific restriction endonuclease McrA